MKPDSPDVQRPTDTSQSSAPSSHARANDNPRSRTSARVYMLEGSIDDAELVQQLAHGQPAAVAQLFDRYAPLLRRIAIRMLGSPTDVDDLVQEALLVVIDKIQELRKPEALRSFAVSVALRFARNELRKRSVRRFVRLSEAPPPSVSSAATTAQGDALRAVYGILDRLDANSRSLFIMRHVEGFQLDELAEVHNCSLATLKRRLSKVDARFRSMVEGSPELSHWLDGGQ